jgi:hypothetical protein
MKINELMIGNYVKCVGCKDNIFQVISLFDGDLVTIQNSDDTFDCMLDRVKPIPITKEWLMKNGFEKRHEKLLDYYYYTKETKDCRFIITIQEISGGYFKCFLDNNALQSCGYADIQYTHQLQNLLNILNIKEEFIV